MTDNEYFNLLCYDQEDRIFKIRPKPEEILSNIDPTILDDMKARIRGEPSTPIYDIFDRIDETSLIREKKKLKKIF